MRLLVVAISNDTFTLYTVPDDYDYDDVEEDIRESHAPHTMVAWREIPDLPEISRILFHSDIEVAFGGDW